MAQIMIRFAPLKKQKKTSKTEKNSGDNIGDGTIEPRRGASEGNQWNGTYDTLWRICYIISSPKNVIVFFGFLWFSLVFSKPA